MSDQARSLDAVGITKRFSGVQALTDVSLSFPAGQITALMGENGAGKSTLLRILGGDHQPDEGALELAGSAVRFAGPAEAHAAGVRVIAQEPEVLPDLTVAENVYLGALPQRGRLLDRRTLFQQVRKDLADIGFDRALDPSAFGRDLSAAQRQLVEILRATRVQAPFMAFDEPTSSLSEQEVASLFRLVRHLRDNGVGIIYVSHRLNEVFDIADRVSVLRDGRHVATVRVADTTEAEVVRMMVGRDLSSMFVRDHEAPGRTLLEVRGLTNDDVHDVSLTVRAGEVVGLAGLVGAGRSELARAIVGDTAIVKGTVLVEGTAVSLHQPQDAVRAGIGYAPEERKAEALFLDRSVRDNASIVILPELRRWRFVRRRAEASVVDAYIARLRVRTPSASTIIRKLSGGNQQKVVLARWLAKRPKILILDEPTRGIDVGAKAEIYQIIADLARDGLAVLVISSELPEVIGLADRILVMQNGHITGELSRENATEEAILGLAMADDLPTTAAGGSA